MQRQVVRLGTGEMEYVDTGGPGTPLVLLHGALMDEGHWWPVVELLADEVRCVVPVLPLGAHRLPMPDADVSPAGVASLVAELIHVLDLDRPVLAGNDTGGAIAQLLAAAHPEEFGGLVLVSCDAFDNFPPGLPGRTMALACAVPGGLRSAMVSLRISAFRRLPMTFGWMTKRPIDDATFRGWLAAYGAEPAVRRDIRRFMAGVDRHQLVEAAASLERFSTPALVVWAGDDRVMPRSHADRLVGALPHARLEIVPDSYTLVPLDRPEHLAELLREIVTTAPARPRREKPTSPSTHDRSAP